MTFKLFSLQFGKDADSTKCFGIERPAVPDGSISIFRGKIGAKIAEVLKIMPDNSIQTVDGSLLRMAQSAVINTTSGTAHDLLNVPSWAKRVTLSISGISTNGTSYKRIQLGSGTIQNTGYLGTMVQLATTSMGCISTGVGGFDFPDSSGMASAYSGHVTLTNAGGNKWVVSGWLGRTDASYGLQIMGEVTLTGPLDRMRFTTVNGTDAYDAGSIRALYEG